MTTTISIRNLRKSYGEKEVLKGIDLDIFPGQVIGYIGPNGAGKSTTVKILCGLISDYEGEITIQGLSLRDNTLKIKSHIGYVPELAELYEVLTPMEFLSFIATLYDIPTALAEERIVRIMTGFGLLANLHQRMESFSKGMKQKVLITSGLLHNPDILILDEPLSGLDANSVIVIKDLISRLAQEGKTIFYCSHMMDVVEKVSDKIILIDGGTIVANGSFDELKSQLGESSLERMFANLTAGHSLNKAADSIMDAMHRQSAEGHE